MHTLDELLDVYGRYHTQASNKMTHYIAIPALTLGVLMLLNWFRLDIAGRWLISFAWIATIVVLVYYYLLNVRLAALATVMLFIFTWIATLLAGYAPTKFSFILFLILFIGGGALQFIGHNFENNKPAFVSSLKFLLIGPLFVMIEGLKKLGYDKYFEI